MWGGCLHVFGTFRRESVLWGRLFTCGGLAIRLPRAPTSASGLAPDVVRRIANPPQLAKLPHKKAALTPLFPECV